MDKSNRGGSRPGSGRPVGTVKTGSGGNKNLFQIKLPDDAARWLESAGGNLHMKELVLQAFEASKKA
ncbi:MAG: hypothetical protein E6R03_13870 [Hyphomicrobiaceae bacterium]|nr:MAG: hypothetical protein E6R03_13870 [Hyphomicrobiaceae bacterium]